MGGLLSQKDSPRKIKTCLFFLIGKMSYAFLHASLNGKHCIQEGVDVGTWWKNYQTTMFYQWFMRKMFYWLLFFTIIGKCEGQSESNGSYFFFLSQVFIENIIVQKIWRSWLNIQLFFNTVSFLSLAFFLLVNKYAYSQVPKVIPPIF